MMSSALGTRVVHLAEVGSTNAEAMRLAAASEAGPLWVTADVQTGGKGRSGREWVSRPGNLFASYMFQTAAPIATAHQLSLVAGVAVFDALLTCGLGRQHGLRLKWPNDVLIGRAKAGGILVESSMLPGQPNLTAVIGIGLNLASHPEIAGRDVTSLAAQGVAVAPADALQALDAALTAALSLWDESRGFAAVRSAWLERCGAVGERLTVQLPQGAITGAFAGLDLDGALLVEIEGGEVRRCTYGDVTIA
ncbi:MAG: biotin--[acetyl-CoA-carboxylase] ligase [Hyphomicrobiaceae bacterium]|nr:biotin--[acetyl-CoA-carboxylase] ligase [Hyphomicrobiaceae bacterium]